MLKILTSLLLLAHSWRDTELENKLKARQTAHALNWSYRDGIHITCFWLPSGEAMANQHFVNVHLWTSYRNGCNAFLLVPFLTKTRLCMRSSAWCCRFTFLVNERHVRVLKPTLLKLQLKCAAVVHSSITHSRLVFLLGHIVSPIASRSTQREMMHPHNIHNTCFILLYDFHPHWIPSNTCLLNEVSAKPESSSFLSWLS